MAYDPRDKAQNWLPGYLRAVADKMALKDWAFRIYCDSPDRADALATMEPIPAHRLGVLRLGEDFWKESRNEQRKTITHELLHCHFRDSQEWLRVTLKPRVYRPWLLMHEGGIDSVADALAPFMPLPPHAAKKDETKNHLTAKGVLSQNE